MKTITKIILPLIIVTTLGVFGYTKYYNTPRLVSKSGKKMTIKFRGKNINIDVVDLSNRDMSITLGKWDLIPSYGNKSDKSTLNGLNITKNNVIYKTLYF